LVFEKLRGRNLGPRLPVVDLTLHVFGNGMNIDLENYVYKKIT